MINLFLEFTWCTPLLSCSDYFQFWFFRRNSLKTAGTTFYFALDPFRLHSKRKYLCSEWTNKVYCFVHSHNDFPCTKSRTQKWLIAKFFSPFLCVLSKRKWKVKASRRRISFHHSFYMRFRTKLGKWIRIWSGTPPAHKLFCVERDKNSNATFFYCWKCSKVYKLLFLATRKQSNGWRKWGNCGTFAKEYFFLVDKIWANKHFLRSNVPVYLD